MIRERTAGGIRPYVLDIVLGGLSVGAHFIFYSAIGDYIEGRYEFPSMLTGTSAILFYGGTIAVYLLCILVAPLMILVRLFWRCRKDGLRGMAIRAVILAAALAPPWLLAGPAAVERSHEMRLRGFAARVRSQEADIVAIREWLKTSRPPAGDVEQEKYVVETFDPTKYPDGVTPRAADILEDGSVVYMYWPRPLRALNPRDARVLEDGCVELEWSQRDVGAWGITIAPTEHFPQEEEYRLRMAAGGYTKVHPNGETTEYKEYMVQLSPGVYAWLRPRFEPPDPFPSEGS